MREIQGLFKGFFNMKGTCLGVPRIRAIVICGSILRSTCFGKLPYKRLEAAGLWRHCATWGGTRRTWV